MINPDELDAPRPQTKLRDLQPMSIEELEDYIASMEQEIARADAMIRQKQTHKNDIEALFGKGTTP